MTSTLIGAGSMSGVRSPMSAGASSSAPRSRINHGRVPVPAVPRSPSSSPPPAVSALTTWCSPCPAAASLRLSNWRRAVFLPARNRAGVSARFRIHDLRHTAASLMIQAGYPPKMLQEIMGHASITTTLDLYGHLYPGDMDRYADRLDERRRDADAAKMRPDEDEDESGMSA